MRYQEIQSEQGLLALLACYTGGAMPFVDEEAAEAYRRAWSEWRKQVDHVHRVFLDGEDIRPDQLKGLLNREARKKEAYDAARARLLGIDTSPLPMPGGDTNPFKS